jgi:hypothetical protein
MPTTAWVPGALCTGAFARLTRSAAALFPMPAMFFWLAVDVGRGAGLAFTAPAAFVAMPAAFTAPAAVRAPATRLLRAGGLPLWLARRRCRRGGTFGLASRFSGTRAGGAMPE